MTRLLRSFESALRLAGFATALGLGGCHATNARSPARPGADRSSYVIDMPATAEDVAGRAPYRLTAATGDSLRLRALEARVMVEAPFAQTELRLTFDPAQQPDVLGLLDIALPASALITRLAFRADGDWREANVTARIDPGRSPEELLHRPPKPDAVFWEVLASEQEPLVGEAGAEPRTRVYLGPLSTRRPTEVLVAYFDAKSVGGAPVRVPLAGQPRLDRVDVQFLVAPYEEEPFSATRTSYTPRRDIQLLTPQEAALTARRGPLAVSRVTLPDATAHGEAASDINSLLVLFDTSASRAAEFDDRVAWLGALVDRLSDTVGDTPLTVVGFDQDARLLYRGTVAGFSRGARAEVARVRPLGASNLERAFVAAMDLVTAGDRVVVVSDGFATSGSTGASTLASAAARLRDAGVSRIDAIARDDLYDREALLAITRAPGDSRRAGLLLDGAVSPARCASRLLRPVVNDVTVTVPGSRWSWPRTLHGQPGDSVLVFAELAPALPLRVRLDGRTIPVAGTANSAGPLIERGVHAARVMALEERLMAAFVGPVDARVELRRRLMSRSMEYGVLSSQTTLAAPSAVISLVRPNERFGDPMSMRDRDGDGHLDDADQCPDEPETFNTFEDEDGCGDHIPSTAIVEPTSPAVLFRHESARLDSSARAKLRRITPSQVGRPELIELVSYTDSDERGAARLALERADAVARYFVKLGVAESRIRVRPVSHREAQRSIESRFHTDTRRVELRLIEAQQPTPPLEATLPPHTGRYAEFRRRLDGDPARALEYASTWRDSDPRDLLALIALGEALEATGDAAEAARAYGSLIDLYPFRADVRRHAGQRLERLRGRALELALDTYNKAVEMRPGHPSGYHLLGLALARAGRWADAYTTLFTGYRHGFYGMSPEARAMLGADIETVAATLVREDPARRGEVVAELAAAGLGLPDRDALRFVLSWESYTAADLLVRDGHGDSTDEHHGTLPSGGFLENDVQFGYGPEGFMTEERSRAFPYSLGVRYREVGPLGVGMGTIHVIEHGESRSFSVTAHPFTIMNDGAELVVATVGRSPR